LSHSNTASNFGLHINTTKQRCIQLISSESQRFTKFELPSFTNYKDIAGPQNLKMGHVTLTTPIMGSLSS